MKAEYIQYLQDHNAIVIYSTKSIHLKISQNGDFHVWDFNTIDELYEYIDNQLCEDNLTVEISGRQTGKTYRLCEAIVKNYQKGKKSYLFTHSDAWGRQLMSIILNECKIPKHYIFLNVADTSSIDLSDSRCFFDEFDFGDRVFYSPTGYYATSPRICRTLKALQDYRKVFNASPTKPFIEQDFLLFLLYKVDFNIVNNLCPDEWVKAFRQTGGDLSYAEIGIPVM